jgi:diaminohydroxyphosphoribosylaminopyrimidine deaminase/5-amino-6-(5-phosphoribosylamino)uracil reductase
MAQALDLARRGLGATSPNPPVGAVVVRNRRVVGAGYHRRAGGPHAEVFALRQAGARARGATLYVTLEPCGHTEKRTPPCVPLILNSGVRRVVIATRDPNPQVAGRGLAALRRAGLKVELGVAQTDAYALIESYRMRVTRGRPFVTLKVAATLDGKIATASGESQWITGALARRLVHRLRAQSDAVLVGVGTVIADNPSLTVHGKGGVLAPRGRGGIKAAKGGVYSNVAPPRPRDYRSAPGNAGKKAGTRQPTRIVLDPQLRTPLSSKVLTDRSAPTIIVTTSNSPKTQRQTMERLGVEVLVIPDMEGRIVWKVLLQELGQRGMNVLLIEGGGEVNATALRSGVVDRVIFFMAPQLLGGRDAIGAIGGTSPLHLANAIRLRDVTVSRVGKDLMVEGRVRAKKPLKENSSPPWGTRCS